MSGIGGVLLQPIRWPIFDRGQDVGDSESADEIFVKEETIVINGLVYTIRYDGSDKPVQVTVPTYAPEPRGFSDVVTCECARIRFDENEGKERTVINPEKDYTESYISTPLIINFGPQNLIQPRWSRRYEDDKVGFINQMEKRTIAEVARRLKGALSSGRKEDAKKLRTVLTALKRVADDGRKEALAESKPAQKPVSPPKRKARPPKPPKPVIPDFNPEGRGRTK